MGEIHDGIAPHMSSYPADRTFLPATAKPVDIEKRLRESGAEVMLCYLPVGSQKAVERYARACLETGVSLLNCMPVFIVSNEKWAAEFTERKIPVVGDDVKSQLGSTILHRTIMKLFADRGIKLKHTYQLNTGGNTDFLNMLDRARLGSKRTSKTEAVQSNLPERMPDVDVHIGPSDYIPWQNDNKVCFLRIEGEGFAGIPIELELRMSVQDSPELGRCRDRRDPLPQAGARSQNRRPALFDLCLHDETSAAPDPRRYRTRPRREVHLRRARTLTCGIHVGGGLFRWSSSINASGN